MSIKILVLCQRKKGRCEDNGIVKTVQSTIIPNIKQYLTDYLHTTDYKIDYLSDLINDDKQYDDEVDFNLKIEDPRESELSDRFLKGHAMYYSVIVLNTCPYRFVNFLYIRHLMSDNGVVILSNVNCRDVYSPKLFIIPPTHRAISQSNILDFFEYENGFYISKKKSNTKSIPQKQTNRNTTNKGGKSHRIKGTYKKKPKIPRK